MVYRSITSDLKCCVLVDCKLGLLVGPDAFGMPSVESREVEHLGSVAMLLCTCAERLQVSRRVYCS